MHIEVTCKNGYVETIWVGLSHISSTKITQQDAIYSKVVDVLSEMNIISGEHMINALKFNILAPVIPTIMGNPYEKYEWGRTRTSEEALAECNQQWEMMKNSPAHKSANEILAKIYK